MGNLELRPCPRERGEAHCLAPNPSLRRARKISRQPSQRNEGCPRACSTTQSPACSPRSLNSTEAEIASLANQRESGQESQILLTPCFSYYHPSHRGSWNASLASLDEDMTCKNEETAPDEEQTSSDADRTPLEPGELCRWLGVSPYAINAIGTEKHDPAWTWLQKWPLFSR